ncbi:MAG: hypothetical protein HY716_02240 [Planctomycetes bacterium]|nr:hypothetical protein [Planctomycetota bacterium]
MRLALLAFAASMLSVPPAQEARVVAHEWGTFTTLAGSDGLSLEWRPLAGRTDLPSFVYTVRDLPQGLRNGPPRSAKEDLSGTVRMETPVLYFYADRETTISVNVEFPKGQITEWYPQAREVHTGINWGKIRMTTRSWRCIFSRTRTIGSCRSVTTRCAGWRGGGKKVSKAEIFPEAPHEAVLRRDPTALRALRKRFFPQWEE